MAASITVGSLSLASDGVTLTATLSGGTGSGYAITTPAGLQPHISGANGDIIVPLATPTISSTTLTIVLPTPFLSGATVQFNTTAASSLTDSGSNTIVVASNTAVTNNSTVTGTLTNIISNLSSFNFNGSAQIVGTSGLTDLNASSSGLNTADNTGYSCEWVVNVTAGTTSLDIEGYFSSTLYYQVDGGSQQSYVGDNVGFQLIRIATGLAVGKHVVRHNLPNNFYTKGVRTVGGTASIVTVQCPTALFQDSVPNATAGTVTSPAKRWGTQHVTNSGQVGAYINNVHPGFQFNITGSFTGVDVCSYTSSTAWSFGVAVDQIPGAPIGTYTRSGMASDTNLNNQYQMNPVVSGLSAGTHTVEVLDIAQLGWKTVRVHNGSALASSASSGAGTISVGDITNIADGDWLCLDHLQNEEIVKVSSHSGSGPYTLTLASNLAKNHSSGAGVRNFTPANAPTLTGGSKPTFAGRLCVMGDSITHAAASDPSGSGIPTGYNNYDVRASHAFIAARAINYEFIGGATQGWTAAQVATDNAPTNSDVNKPATIYEILIGTNDFGAANTALASYEASMETIINQCKTAAPSGTLILVQKIFSSDAVTTNAGGHTKADFNAQQLTAIANTSAATYTIQQIDLAAAAGLNLTPASADIPDSTHPSITSGGILGTGGQNKMAAALIPFLSTPIMAASGMFS